MSEIRDARIDLATKVVSTHMKQQNPHYAQLECMMKVVPAPSVSRPTEVIRQLEGNARIVVVDWSAQGEIPTISRVNVPFLETFMLKPIP